MQYKHEVILCIVNAGFSEMVMDAAREFGARGGTVLHARGTAKLEAEKAFNISIQPEKDIVMILVESGIRDAVLHALYQNVGLQTAGAGIAFSLPVESVVGLSQAAQKPAEAAKEAATEAKTGKTSEQSAEKAAAKDEKEEE